MTTRTVQTDAEGLESVSAALLGGGVAVIPTDTVYGLAAHPDFPEAVARLYTIKTRGICTARIYLSLYYPNPLVGKTFCNFNCFVF